MINPDSTLPQIIKFGKLVLHKLFPNKPRITSYAIAVLAVYFERMMEPGFLPCSLKKC